jgi:putative DNA primase/helicase
VLSPDKLHPELISALQLTNGHGEWQERAPTDSLGVVNLSAIEPRPIEWLWPSRIAAGKLTLFAGDPGLGKSQIAIDIAARITTGSNWPDDGRAPVGNVIILSAEDGIADTLRPRFDAAGGNLERARAVTSISAKDGSHRTVSLQADLGLLGHEVRQFGGVKLVVIDPITSYCGKVDGNSTTDIRAVLAPLSEFAERHELAIIAVSHPPKSAAGGKALYAVTGSLAWIAAARTAFTIVEDADEPDRRLFLNSKNNLARFAPGLGYRLMQRIVTGDCLTSHIEWDNAPVTVSADQALAATAGGSEARTAREEAEQFLRDLLAGGPVSAREGEKQARELGIASRTLKRAREKVGVVAEKGGLKEGWTWRLPPEGGQHSRRGPASESGTLRDDWHSSGADRAPTLGPPGDSLDDFR